MLVRFLWADRKVCEINQYQAVHIFPETYSKLLCNRVELHLQLNITSLFGLIPEGALLDGSNESPLCEGHIILQFCLINECVQPEEDIKQIEYHKVPS